MDCKQISSFLSLFYPDVCCSVVFYAMLLIPFPPYSVKMQGIKKEISILTHFLKKTFQYCLNVVGGYLYPSLPFFIFFKITLKHSGTCRQKENTLHHYNKKFLLLPNIYFFF